MSENFNEDRHWTKRQTYLRGIPKQLTYPNSTEVLLDVHWYKICKKKHWDPATAEPHRGTACGISHGIRFQVGHGDITADSECFPDKSIGRACQWYSEAHRFTELQRPPPEGLDA